MTDDKKLSAFFSKILPIKTKYRLIRVGNKDDGGYLLPNDLVGVKTCFSPGVERTASFELDLLARGIKCHLADYSVDEPPIQHKLISFEKKFIGSVADSCHITLHDWIYMKAPNDKNMILQMDIESDEYPVLLSTDSEILTRFRILIIEFHDLDALLDTHAFELINLTFMKLFQNFSIVHIHPNNCRRPIKYKNYSIPPVMEITFLRNDRILQSKPYVKFPNKLDERNIKSLPDIELPNCWIN